MPKKQKKPFKWSWADTVIAISVACLLLVGGVIYAGTVMKPQQEAQSDKEACTHFNSALANAYKTTTAKDFYYVLFRGAYKGIEETREGTEINDDFIGLAQLEEYVNNTTWNSMLVTVGDFTSKVQATCAVILDVDVQGWDSNIPHATSSPTPTN